MRKIVLVTSLMLTAINLMMAQTNLQMKNWFISPKQIKMPFGTNPTISLLPAGAPNTQQKIANGMYDVNDNLLFYVSDGNVYDYNSTLIGAINPVPQGGEIAIVPFGDNDNSTQLSCKRKYSIFTTGGGFVTQTSVLLVHTVLDLNSFSLTSTVVDNMPWQQEFGSIAVSKPNTNSDRYVYFMAASGYSDQHGEIHKLVLDKYGNVSPSSVLLAAFPRSGEELFSRELELSPDGEWLAWARYLNDIQGLPGRYKFIDINPITGNVASGATLQGYSIPGITGNNASGFRGMEFYQTGTNTYNLFMGAGSDGIYFTNFPTNSSFTQVTFSNLSAFYGFSQIEHSFNGNMYVSSSGTSSNNVAAFNPSIATPAIISGQPSLTLTSPWPPNSGWQGVPFYTLPDQIDGENYSNSLAQPIPLPLPKTEHTILVNVGGNTIWSYAGTNPWGVTSALPSAQVIKEIHISGNSTLTIDGMTIKFSPAAKVIIDAGSKLILDNGAVLTSDFEYDPCLKAYYWTGVEVRGDINQSQNLVPQVQGQLIVRNSSRIEWALWGARNWNPANLNTTGGIINVESTGGSFRNCKIGVDFKPYQNIIPNTMCLKYYTR